MRMDVKWQRKVPFNLNFGFATSRYHSKLFYLIYKEFSVFISLQVIFDFRYIACSSTSVTTKVGIITENTLIEVDCVSKYVEVCLK
ncbi:hypothetical protein NIES4075_00190 [Tolypothrix sp. NIES-4075]|nr:hypothetical protein NIES4075_00190 [Tolypothrix sp. NIES-4075]